MMEIVSKSLYQKSETSPVYVNPEQKPDINNVRLRHSKSNIPTETTSQPAHFVLSTGDYQSNETINDLHLISRNKHNKSRIFLLIFTALSYLLHTLRNYIPENIQTLSHFWSSIKPIPIPRVYTSDFRSNLFIENLLLHLAEIFQTFWLVYILSYIPRQTHIGYLYRNPNIFNSFFCLLLISALSLRTISQTPLPPEILCVCLFISLILLIITCRLITIKLLKYEEKFKLIDLNIIRYFVLNSLFLYTTSITYLTICFFIESFAFHFDPTLTIVTTIGLSIVLILLLIYFILDQFVYENEFRSIWTPYLFILIVFHCPPLRKLLSNEVTDDWNFYLLWTLFGTTILIIMIRIGRQLFIKYYQRKIKSLIDLSIEQKTLETGNE